MHGRKLSFAFLVLPILSFGCQDIVSVFSSNGLTNIESIGYTSKHSYYMLFSEEMEDDTGIPETGMAAADTLRAKSPIAR